MNCNSSPITLFFVTPREDHFENILIILFVISIVNYSWSLFGESSFKDSNNHFMEIRQTSFDSSSFLHAPVSVCQNKIYTSWRVRFVARWLFDKILETVRSKNSLSCSSVSVILKSPINIKFS